MDRRMAIGTRRTVPDVGGLTAGIDRKTRDKRRTISTCHCPACLGLECLDRPRYFAGQLLTEAELNSEQTYVLAKNRLHNRYLHGSGVVCGLQVICHDCEGWVTVKQGYAIDPCGNDVIVCEEHDFDVVKAIRECRESRRKRRSDCDPLRTAVDEECKDLEEHWCITIAYEETEARPIATLKRERTSVCTPACDEKGIGYGSCCHNQGDGKKSSSSAMKPTTKNTLAACEPTRIYEGYRLGVLRVPEGFCDEYRVNPQVTLLERIQSCVTGVFGFVGERVSKAKRETTYGLLAHKVPTSTVAGGATIGTFGTAQQLYTACCYLYQAVRDLYLENPYGVYCGALDVLDQIHCAMPTLQESGEVSAEDVLEVQKSIYDLMALLLQYVIDCVCMALLPPCPSDPMDDRLILACVTVKQDRIVRICNFSCRHHAGAFPTLAYWFSIVPIVPAITKAIHWLCCDFTLIKAESPIVNRFTEFLESLDPTGDIRKAIFEDDFALPKMYAGQISGLQEKLSIHTLSQMIQPKEVNLSKMVGKTPDEVEADIEARGLVAKWREVKSVDDVPLTARLTMPFVSPGDKVTLYRTKDKVVGFGRHDPKTELEEKQAELDSIKTDLAALRKEVETLKGGGQTTARRRKPS